VKVCSDFSETESVVLNSYLMGDEASQSWSRSLRRSDPAAAPAPFSEA
jgi:hypothetical protein